MLRISAASGPDISMMSPSTYASLCRTVEALQHGQRATDFDFLDQDRLFRIRHGFVHRLFDALAQAFEAQVKPLSRAFLDVQDVVHRDAVRPGMQPAPGIKLREPRHDTHEDFLRRVLGILLVPEHPKREPVDLRLQFAHDDVQGSTIPVDREPYGFFQWG